MGDEEQLGKLIDARTKSKKLGDEAVRLQKEENERLKQAVETQIRVGQEQITRRILNDLDDPLLGYADRASDVEFLPEGGINPKTLQRAIFQWRDADGNEIYTRENYAGQLPEIRALRNKVVAQQTVWGGLASDKQSRIQNDWQSSGAKAPNALPFKDFLTSQALGERFKQLQQNPLRPTLR